MKRLREQLGLWWNLKNWRPEPEQSLRLHARSGMQPLCSQQLGRGRQDKHYFASTLQDMLERGVSVWFYSKVHNFADNASCTETQVQLHFLQRFFESCVTFNLLFPSNFSPIPSKGIAPTETLRRKCF